MLTFARIATKPAVFQVLTGLSLQAFLDLLPAFHQATAELEHQAEQRRKQPRKRQKGGGRKPLLSSGADRLLFILFYFKVYPLQAVQAFFFGMSQAQACEWIDRLTPVLNRALGFEQQLPARNAADVAQVLRQCPGLEFIIDGTERRIQRPKDKQRQRDYYSGKKKRHTVKNVTIGDRRTRKIKALSRTRSGKTSDKRTADEEDYHFPARSKLWKDTGFQGYEPPKVRTYQPKKKPPKGELTAEEKASNQAISRKRVRIEHSIGGAKVFHIARDVFRNRRDEYVDLSFETACGLHNLRCDYRLSATA
jgi:DDE superfamily endonuclease/Helix-turn-helix of DDE superfamily endonuclease